MRSPVLEMFERYAQALVANAPLALVAVALAVALALPRVRERRPPAALRAALLAAAVLGGVAWGWQLRWLGDDAFISFRYAENLATGHGLVFNPGERVEGYTNFLWTLLLAGLIALGFDPARSAIALGLACFAALIAVVARAARRLEPGAPPPAVPVAALLAASSYALACYATSGMETMFAALLAAIALERALAAAPLAAGLAGVAATLAHPDHGILYAALGIALAWGGAPRAALARYAAPFLLLFVPYFLWRWSYYGDLFPNTFYAKSADRSYFEQGWRYLASFAIGSGLWLAAPVVAAGAWVRRRELLGRYLLVAVPAFALYVAKIGGDFMYARLLCPLLAPLLLAAEVGLRAALRAGGAARAALAAVALALMAVPTPLFGPGEKKWHISDERSFYRVGSVAPLEIHSTYFRWARALREHFVARGAWPRLAMQCVGTVGYYTGLPLVDLLGITDRTVGRLPIGVRGRPGHEKLAPAAYALGRDVDISDTPLYPAPYRARTVLRLDGLTFYLGRFDPALLAPLRGRPGVAFADFEAQLARYLERDTPRAPDAVACDAWFFEEFYFSRVRDAPARREVERRLLEAGRARGEPGAAFAPGRSHRPDPATAIRFEPGAPDPVRFRDAAGRGLDALGARRAGGAVGSHRGSFLSTAVPPEGEAAALTLRSSPLPLVGDVMELWVGGGRDAQRLRVSLFVDGTRRFSATGCDTDALGRRLWQIAPFRGRTGVLEIADDARGARGHLAVDEVVQWSRVEPVSGDAGGRGER